MKKSTNKSNHNSEGISNADNKLPCPRCLEERMVEPHLQLTNSPYCWNHMSHKEKQNYKKFIKEQDSLRKFILSGADLSEIDLSGIDLSKSILCYTNLSKANLKKVSLIKADLRKADLSGAKLAGAILKNANLEEAILSEANLSESDLSNVNLRFAYIIEADLDFCNLSNADLSFSILIGSDFLRSNLSNANFWRSELKNAKLDRVDLTNVNGLRISNFYKRLTKFEKKNPSTYQESYLFVKNYFLKMGFYDDASEAAYREKVLQRLSYLKFFKIINLIKAIISIIWSALCGYGEKAWRPVVSALVIILGYGLFYWYANVLEPAQDLLGSMYFSIVTFTTLGYGDIKPIEYDNVFRFICSSEAFIGAFMIALFVWTLARRGAAR